MKLSILLTTYNRRRWLARTFPTLLAQDFPPDQYEIVVVVDGSTDGSAELLRSLPARCAVNLIEQPNAGQVAAQNVGLAAARGDIVLIMDDEVICPPGLVRAHVAAHEPGGRHVVFGPFKLASESPDSIASDWLSRWIRNYVEVDGILHPRPDYVALATVSPNTSARREELLAAGGFDQTFPATQDVELGLRLRQRGVHPRFEPDAVAYLVNVKNDRDLVRNAAREGRDFVKLGHRHPAFRHYLPLARLGHAGGLHRVLLRLGGSCPAAFEPLLRLPYWMAERLRFVPAVRRVGLRLLEYRRLLPMLHSAAAEAGSWDALQALFGRRLPVLLYHHVGPPRAGANPALTVSPQQFAAHVVWLADNGFTGISAAQWWQWCEQGTALPERPVLLTFDDAYADLDQHALPVLRRHGFSATVFVVTSCIGGASTWDEPFGWTPHPCLSEPQIRSWAGQGIDFGSHSHTHPDLTELPATKVEYELAASAAELQRILGQKTVAFAFPFGRHNDRVRAGVSAIFALAFTLQGGMNGPSSDPYSLRRNWVFADDTWLDLRGRVRWGKSPVRGVRLRLQPLMARAKQLIPLRAGS